MSPQAGWILLEEIVPRLRGAVPHSVLCVGAEDSTDLVHDGIAMAARMPGKRKRKEGETSENMRTPDARTSGTGDESGRWLQRDFRLSIAAVLHRM